MTMYGPDATREILNCYLDVGTTPKNLPGFPDVNGGVIGFVSLLPSGPNQGKPFTPGHAYINVEGGDVRMRCDGQDPDDTIGTLYPENSVIDWSSPLVDYQGLIKNCRVVAIRGATNVRLTISYRN